MTWIAIDLTDGPEKLVTEGTFNFQIVAAEIGQNASSVTALKLRMRVCDGPLEGQELTSTYVIAVYSRTRLRRLLTAAQLDFTAQGFDAALLVDRRLRAYAYNHENRYWTIKNEEPVATYETWTIDQLEAEAARLQQHAEELMDTALPVSNRAVHVRRILEEKRAQARKEPA